MTQSEGPVPPPNGHHEHAVEDDARRRAALDLVELGMRVFPVHTVVGRRCSCGDAECTDQGKHPRVSRWQEVASSDAAVVSEWWTRWPTANIGLASGAASGIVVLDVDGAEGMASLAEQEARHGPIGVTPRALTPRPGLHIVFAHPGFHVSNSTGKRNGIAPGLDVRGDGGYIVVPPSLHLNGKRYAWAAGYALGAVELLAMPRWMTPLPEPERVRAPVRLQLVNDARSTNYGRSAFERECAAVRNAREHSRNDQLNVSAFALGQLVGGHVLDENEVRAALLEAALAVGLSRRETFKTISSGVTAGMKEPRGVPDSSWTPPAANDNTESSTLPPSEEPSTEQTPPSSGAEPAPPPPSRIQLVGPPTIFAPLPPMRWVSRDLMIAAGRPTLLAAYGSSAKTLAMQSMLLAICSGHRIWNRFEVTAPLRVVHLDYEQGYRDTYYRYQRLALGHGIELASIGDRLHVGAMPGVYLTTDGAYDDFSRIAESHDLILIDSLRAAVPGVDENESKVRAYIDILTRISDATGCAFILIHHAGKNGGGDGRDARQLARGSSAIFDACGCVLNLTIGKTGSDPRTVSMTKPPASSEGAAIAPFGLVVQDVANESSPVAGVSVTWKALLESDVEQEANRAYEADALRLLNAILAYPGATQHTVAMRAGMKKARAVDVLKGLDDDRRVSVIAGPRGSKTYWPVEVER